jgi:hypothetical protein
MAKATPEEIAPTHFPDTTEAREGFGPCGAWVEFVAFGRAEAMPFHAIGDFLVNRQKGCGLGYVCANRANIKLEIMS